METTTEVEYLTRPDGRVAFDVEGAGPLVLLVPGMGDLRSTYRHLAPTLRAAGYRVAVTDLRGHGDSDPTFETYGDETTAGDLIALVEHLGGPALLVGNSMGAGAAALVAALRPDLVSGLVLIGPFVRDPDVSLATRLILRLVMARPWGARAWVSYLPKLYAGQRPADFDSYRAAIARSLSRPGYAWAFWQTTRQTTHAPVEARLPQVTAPTLVIMGELDPDWTDPAAEAQWIATTMGGDVVMVPDAGHYPQ
ncbi:MAG TPA: alpha/beta hydrolase, partial [Dermatophilaceae bacterium]|nr:alpha/beta hydrolase [Dermatophilaceae bacterium]